MNKIIKKFNLISNTNRALSIFWLIAISLSIIGIAFAAAPNPGHNFTESSGGIATGQLIYGSAADTFSALSSVAAGSYLRSGGVSTAPVWSTPTLPNTAANLKVMIGNGTNWVESTPAYPNASVTAGKVIVSDGTNYIASTPTFPNSSATTRKIIVSDGTNWVASTETHAVPGTSGNVLTSDGTNWTSAAPAVRTVYNQSVTTPAAGFASDTYLVGSSVAIPATGLRVGTRYHLIFQASKTAAGTATPILTIRFGTAGAIGDTSRCAMTWTAQTGATDTGIFEVWATFRTIGSGTSAVIQCVGQRTHGASVTGFGNLVSQVVATTGGGFDSTVANSIIGVSVNGGASAAWTITLVQAELMNLP